MGSKDNIINNITSKFKDKLLELEGKRKLIYYKEVINPTLDNHNFLSLLSNNKKKMNIATIITNYHEIQSEARWWSIPKSH